jgi:hypothetical protein
VPGVVLHLRPLLRLTRKRAPETRLCVFYRRAERPIDKAPGLRELIALSLLAGLGFGVALAHGDLIFVAVFACAIAMTTNEAIRLR